MFADSLLIYESIKALNKVSALEDLVFENRALTSDVAYKPQGLLYHSLVAWAKNIVATLEKLLNVRLISVCEIGQDPESLQFHNANIFIIVWLTK